MEESTVRLFTETELARQLNISVATVRRWRYVGGGPSYVKAGQLVRYSPHDVDAWVEQKRVSGGRVA